MVAKAILTEGLTKQFGDTAAVSGLDLEVEAGRVFGFLGRNGAGKTTTIKMMLDLLRPTSGRVEVLGLDPQRDNVRLKQRVGYVAEVPVLYGWMRVGEIISFTGRLYPTWNPDKVTDLLTRFGLDPEARVKSLSRGMNAQLALALALGHDPEVLILDEPATGLDVLVRRDFLESIVHLIQEEGGTVFLSSHLVHEVERVADQVAIIEAGQLVVGGDVDVVKGQMKKVLVRSDEDFSSLLALEDVGAIEGEGRSRLVTVRNYGPQVEAAIVECGAEIVEVIALSLEEAFIEYVRPRAQGNGSD